MRIIRWKATGNKIQSNTRILGVHGVRQSARLRADVSAWDALFPGATYALIAMWVDPEPREMVIPLESRSPVDGNIFANVANGLLSQAGPVALELRAYLNKTEVKTAQVYMDVLATPNRASPQIIAEQDSVTLAMPKGPDENRPFVFAHMTDADGTRTARRLRGDERDDAVSYKLDGLSGETTVQFAVEDVSGTRWQSDEQLYTAAGAQEVNLEPGDIGTYEYSEQIASEKPPVMIAGRKMSIPADVVEIGVAGDRNAETVTFICDRYYDGFDLRNRHWYVEVQNASVEYDIVAPDVMLGENTITVIWTVNARHALYHGKVKARLRATDGEAYIWQTHTGDFTVYETFAQTAPAPAPGLSYADALIRQVEDIRNATEEYRDSARAAAKSASYINEETGTWMVWDGDEMQYKDTGVHATGPTGQTGVPGGLSFPAFETDPLTGELSLLYPNDYPGPAFELNNGILYVLYENGDREAVGSVSIRPMGEYAADVEYPFLSVVTYGGSGYIAAQSIPAGVLPGLDQRWNLLAAKGAGMSVLDVYATVEDLRAAHPIGNPGDAYAIGGEDGAYQYVWSTARGEWENIGSMKGADGTNGTNGTNGMDGNGVPASGLPGQFTAKKSDDDYDIEWRTPEIDDINGLKEALDDQRDSINELKDALEDVAAFLAEF